MADVTISDFAAIATVPLATDLLEFEVDPGGTPASKKGTVQQLATGLVGLGNYPKFSVTKGGTDQTAIATATPTVVTWSTEVFDSNGNFASNRFTPTVAGKYLTACLVLYTVGIASSAVDYYLDLYKNGSVVAEAALSSVDATQFVLVAIVTMNGSTDYLELQTYQNSGTDKVISGAVYSTNWSGALLP